MASSLDGSVLACWLGHCGLEPLFCVLDGHSSPSVDFHSCLSFPTHVLALRLIHSMASPIVFAPEWRTSKFPLASQNSPSLSRNPVSMSRNPNPVIRSRTVRLPSLVCSARYWSSSIGVISTSWNMLVSTGVFSCTPTHTCLPCSFVVLFIFQFSCPVCSSQSTASAPHPASTQTS